MESKGIHVVVDPSKCVGCNICELWCSYEHEGVFSRSLSRISVITYERLGFDYPVVCQQCEPAPCVELCPTGALSKGIHRRQGAQRLQTILGGPAGR
jgi:Fe-S-cluster-containing hydrogenase component 2